MEGCSFFTFFDMEVPGQDIVMWATRLLPFRPPPSQKGMAAERCANGPASSGAGDSCLSLLAGSSRAGSLRP